MSDLAIALLVGGVTWLVVSDWLRALNSTAEARRAQYLADAFRDSGDYDDAIRLGNSHNVRPISDAPSFDRIAAIIAANEAARELDQLDQGVPEGWDR